MLFVHLLSTSSNRNLTITGIKLDMDKIKDQWPISCYNYTCPYNNSNNKYYCILLLAIYYVNNIKCVSVITQISFQNRIYILMVNIIVIMDLILATITCYI